MLPKNNFFYYILTLSFLKNQKVEKTTTATTATTKQINELLKQKCIIDIFLDMIK